LAAARDRRLCARLRADTKPIWRDKEPADMPELTSLGKSKAVRNTAIGIGVAVLVPVAVAFLAPYVRPAARSLVKAGLQAWEKGKEVAAEVGEVMDDLVAEVRDELREEREQAVAAMHEAAEQKKDDA
jgi:hypothetical protein